MIFTDMNTIPADQSIIVIDYNGHQDAHVLASWATDHDLSFRHFSEYSGTSYDPLAGLTVEQQAHTLLSMEPADETMHEVVHTLCTLMDHAITRRATLRGTARLAAGPSLTWDQGRLAMLYSAVTDTETVSNLVGACQHTPVAETAMRFLDAQDDAVQTTMSTLREQLNTLMDSQYGFWLHDCEPNTISLVESSQNVTLFSLERSRAARYIERMIAATLHSTKQQHQFYVNRDNTMENV